MEEAVVLDRRSDVAFAGAGIGYRRRYREALLAGGDEPKPAVLEIIPDHFFANPMDLKPLADRYELVFHEVSLSAGTAAFEDDAHLSRTADLMKHASPFLFTEHLAVTCSPSGLDLGHLAPVWYTAETLNILVKRISRWQDLLNVPVALENITAPFVIPEAEMPEHEFLTELTQRTGCGLLLDVTNLLINSRNFGYDPVEQILKYPIHRVQQVHLAGGKSMQGWWVDSHSEPLELKSLELFSLLRGKAPLVTAIVERDANLPPFADLVSEARRVEKIWKHGMDK